MLEVIKDVLSAEKRADELIEEARTEVNRLRSEFSEEESRRVREANEEAERLVREKLSQAREEQERRVAEAVEDLREQESRFESEGDPRMAGVVREVVELIVTGPGRKNREDGA